MDMHESSDGMWNERMGCPRDDGSVDRSLDSWIPKVLVALVSMDCYMIHDT